MTVRWKDNPKLWHQTVDKARQGKKRYARGNPAQQEANREYFVSLLPTLPIRRGRGPMPDDATSPRCVNQWVHTLLGPGSRAAFGCPNRTTQKLVHLNDTGADLQIIADTILIAPYVKARQRRPR